MADDLTKTGKADRLRVNTKEEHEVRYWCEKFACTKEQLIAASALAGPMAADIEAQLKNRKSEG